MIYVTGEQVMKICKMHEGNYESEEYPQVKWYHYVMVIAILCAVVWANAEKVVVG